MMHLCVVFVSADETFTVSTLLTFPRLCPQSRPAEEERRGGLEEQDQQEAGSGEGRRGRAARSALGAGAEPEEEGNHLTCTLTSDPDGQTDGRLFVRCFHVTLKEAECLAH